MISGDELFRNSKKLGIVPTGKGNWLVAANDGKFYTFSMVSGLSFAFRIDGDFRYDLARKSIVLLNDKRLAVCSKNGLIIIKNGEISLVIDKPLGLADNSINGLKIDKEGGLWAALDNGISRLTMNNGVQIYDHKMGLHGVVLKTEVHDGILYCGTSQGLFKLEKDTQKFVKIPDVLSIWDMTIKNEDLLIAANNGLFKIQNKQIKQLLAEPIYSLFSSRKDSLIIYTTGRRSVLPMSRLSTHEWKILYDQEIKLPLLGFDGAQDKYGNIWVATTNEGLFKFTYPGLQMKRYTVEQGLIRNDDNGLYALNDDMVVGSGNRFLYYDTKYDSFREIHSLRPVMGSVNTTITGLLSVNNSDLVSSTLLPDQCTIAHRDSTGIYHWEAAHFSQPPRSRTNDMLYKDNRLWLSTNNGLRVLNISDIYGDKKDFPTYVKQVRTVNNDSLVMHHRAAKYFVLPYSKNGLRFVNRSSYYQSPDQIMYQYLLVGYEKSWSEWVGEPTRSYVNLPEGKYTFKLRSRNAYGTVSEGEPIVFTILPPWYRSHWAYLVCVLVFVGTAYLLVDQLRRGRVRGRSFKMEGEIEVINPHETNDCENPNGLVPDMRHKPLEVSELKEHETYSVLENEDLKLTTVVPGMMPRKEKPIVLIVADNAEIIESLKRQLGNSSFNLEETKDVIEAIKRVHTLMPDLIIISLKESYLSGDEFCRKLKQNGLTGHIPVILIGENGVTNKSCQKIADGYLIEPVDSTLLRNKVINLVDHRRQLKSLYFDSLHVDPSAVTVTLADELFLRQCIEVVEKNLSDPHFDVKEFVEIIGVNRGQLHRRLGSITGQHTSEFIRTIRLKKAARLLRKNSNAVAQISYEVGFNDPSYFTKCFKKQFDRTPSDYAILHANPQHGIQEEVGSR